REVRPTQDPAGPAAAVPVRGGFPGAVVHRLAGQGPHGGGDRGHGGPRLGHGHGTTVADQFGHVLLGGSAHLPVQFTHPGQSTAGNGLIGRNDQTGQAGLAVQRFQRGHRGHGGAVVVGDDSLGGALDGLGVDLGHDERDLGVHPPGRGVVHHGGTGSSETFGLGTGGGTARGEHRNVDTAEV